MAPLSVVVLFGFLPLEPVQRGAFFLFAALPLGLALALRF
jgi:hypothetical protein